MTFNFLKRIKINNGTKYVKMKTELKTANFWVLRKLFGINKKYNITPTVGITIGCKIVDMIL